MKYMSTFFMRNEIFSETIKNVKLSFFLHFLFCIAITIDSGVTTALSQGGKLS